MRGTLAWIALGLSVAVAGCTTGTRGDGRDGGARADASVVDVPGCDASQDADADGIADRAEGTGDVDADGVPNDHDTDADGDGTPDADEHVGVGPCTIVDSDGDSAPDFLDGDSDNDGLSDVDERTRYFTDPHSRDTDGDGVTDLGEVAAMTDPTDAASTIPDTDFFVVLPYNGDHQIRTLRFGTSIQQADVYFLIDTTGSMQPAIDNVASSLSRIASELTSVIPDVQMGVGHFEDFPFRDGFNPFGPRFYGATTDHPYRNSQDITDSLPAVQSALDGLVTGDGGDGPESQVFALEQTATGAGGTWTFAPGGSYSLPSRTCPSYPDEFVPRRGYPCFRPGSLPIVVMVTDLEWHNGDTTGTRWPWEAISPPPPTLPTAAVALNAIGGRFVGVAVDGMWRTDHEAVARMTGSVDGSGMPLVYGAAAGMVSDAIIDGIGTLVGRTPQDVTTATENVPPNPGDVDATGFIIRITALEGYGPGPGMGYRSHDESVFYGVTPGTTVEFEVEFFNDFVPPPPTAQVYEARIVVLGNGVARLSERRVFIVVPPEGGVVLI